MPYLTFTNLNSQWWSVRIPTTDLMSVTKEATIRDIRDSVVVSILRPVQTIITSQVVIEIKQGYEN